MTQSELQKEIAVQYQIYMHDEDLLPEFIEAVTAVVNQHTAEEVKKALREKAENEGLD